MSNKRTVVLDGSRGAEQETASALGMLTTVLEETGAEVKVFSLQKMKLAHCIGCFGCWLETPGVCRYKEPCYQEILKAWIQSDAVVLFTPVTFGGYSSHLKQIVDRMLPTLLPYMAAYHGEIHHRPRYTRSPRIVGIGMQESPSTVEADVFKLLVGRHAIDMHAPSYAAEVISPNDSADRVGQVFRSLLTRDDSWPFGESIKGLMPLGEDLAGGPERHGPQRACLIIGSPKTMSSSTSGVLGNYLLDRMKEHGWDTESLTLKANLSTPEGEVALSAAVDKVDLLILAFPLYVDALPFLMTRALELIASHRRTTDQRRPLRLFAIVNNGFPESFQNNLALSICRNFAASSNATWMGALALGAGESIIGGGPIKQRSDLGFPMYKIPLGLRAAADALAEGRPVPVEAIRNMAGCPIPYAPFFVWRFLFVRGSIGFWEKRAAGHGISRKAMLARPYAIGAAGGGYDPVVEPGPSGIAPLRKRSL